MKLSENKIIRLDNFRKNICIVFNVNSLDSQFSISLLKQKFVNSIIIPIDSYILHKKYIKKLIKFKSIYFINILVTHEIIDILINNNVHKINFITNSSIYIKIYKNILSNYINKIDIIYDNNLSLSEIILREILNVKENISSNIFFYLKEYENNIKVDKEVLEFIYGLNYEINICKNIYIIDNIVNLYTHNNIKEFCSIVNNIFKNGKIIFEYLYNYYYNYIIPKIKIKNYSLYKVVFINHDNNIDIKLLNLFFSKKDLPDIYFIYYHDLENFHCFIYKNNNNINLKNIFKYKIKKEYENYIYVITKKIE